MHVFEEDDEEGAVYRRVEEDIPLSRRPREQIEIRRDGTASLHLAGPDDRLFEHGGTWTEKAETVVVRLEQAVARRKELRLTLEPRGRLVVKR